MLVACATKILVFWARRWEESESPEKGLVQALDRLEADYARTHRLYLFDIIFSFLYATSPANHHFVFLRRALDCLTDYLGASEAAADPRFLVAPTHTTHNCLAVIQFLRDFSEFLPPKMRLPLFQYHLTKFYMARDARNLPKQFVLAVLLRHLARGVEAKILRAIKAPALLENLLFVEEAECSPVLKQTLTDTFVSIVGRNPEAFLEVVTFCVGLAAGQTRRHRLHPRSGHPHRQGKGQLRLLRPCFRVS